MGVTREEGETMISRTQSLPVHSSTEKHGIYRTIMFGFGRKRSDTSGVNLELVSGMGFAFSFSFFFKFFFFGLLIHEGFGYIHRIGGVGKVFFFFFMYWDSTKRHFFFLCLSFLICLFFSFFSLVV